MSHQFLYHSRSQGGAGWFVAVILTAEAVPLTMPDDIARKITEGLWLSIPDRIPCGGSHFVTLYEGERDFLVLGLRLIADQIRASAAPRVPLVIRVQELMFSECYYQPEGLACAMLGWATKEFGLPPLSVPVTFDREAKRYRFQFPPPESPGRPYPNEAMVKRQL